MISDTLSNYISKDSTCILGLTTLELSGSLFLISPLNRKYVYPGNLNSSIDNPYDPSSPFKQFNEWCKEASIYELSSEDIVNDNFISSENDWNVSTILNLAPKMNNDEVEGDTKFSFATTFSLKESLISDLSNISIQYYDNSISSTINEVISLTKSDFLNGYTNPVTNKDIAIKEKINEITNNSFIQLFKQGSDNLNGVIDCGLNLYKTNDENFGDLKLKIYYFNGVGTSAVNLQEYSFKLDNGFISNFIDNFSMLILTLNSNEGLINVYVNNDLVDSYNLPLVDIKDSPLNLPLLEDNEHTRFTIGGTNSKLLMMRDFFVFNRIINNDETAVLTMMNKGNQIKYEDALTFTALEAGSTIKLSKKCEGENLEDLQLNILYRTKYFDNWKRYDIDTEIVFDNVGEFVQFKNTNNTLSKPPKESDDNYVYFVMSGRLSSSGNVQSLLNYSKSCYFRCFYKLFNSCESLISAPKLPALKLGEACYNSMFNGCSNLIYAPKLSATTLYESCYQNMFNQCTSLVKAPELPAEQLKVSCYAYMFNQCTSLVQAPELPAKQIVKDCYYRMFKDCSSLQYIKVNFKDWTCPPVANIQNPRGTIEWLKNVSSTGTFVKPSDLLEEFDNVGERIPEGWTVINFEDNESETSLE